jgi:hypothetical protein
MQDIYSTIYQEGNNRLIKRGNALHYKKIGV